MRDRRLQSSATALPGLQRVTLNLNPSIGDDGALDLANALQDDLWIKGISSSNCPTSSWFQILVHFLSALDLQFCSLSNTSALTLLEMLHSNTTLMVLDLRDNQLIGKLEISILQRIYSIMSTR